MTDSPWDKMPIEAKLEWLRAAVERITETDKRNIDAQNAVTGQLVKRLGAVEMEVQNIARQVHAIQRKNDA
jgi:hypothetical protein